MARPANCDTPKFISVETYNNVDGPTFQEIVRRGRPAILEDCNFGECLDKWKLYYLNSLLMDQNVVIHESHQADLNFINKNFKYTTCKFSQFTSKLLDLSSNKIDGGQYHVYLRSTNSNPRARKATRIELDFPVLANDLKPPDFIPFGQDNDLYHSSVLRIASACLQIWTHFDLYDNVLAQVVGTKRVILIPPEDTKYLYVTADKSSVNCFDNWGECLQNYPLVERAKLHHCLLKPKQVLYIPSLWWHNIRTVPDSPKSSLESHEAASGGYHSIGFNIFWRDPVIQSRSLYADGDVYGNKDLTPVLAAFANLDKISQHLNKLPGKYKTFYKIMLLERLKRILFAGDGDDGQ